MGLLKRLGDLAGYAQRLGQRHPRSIANLYYTRSIDMDTVTISPKFQVVLPKKLREELGLKAGAKMRVVRYGDRIELLPARRAIEMKGFLKGMDTSVPRDRDRA